MYARNCRGGIAALLLLLAVLPLPGFGAAASCTPPKVVVGLDTLDHEAFQKLRSVGFPTKQDWIAILQRELLKRLEASSPGVEFLPFIKTKIPASKKPEYLFTYTVYLRATDHGPVFWISSKLTAIPSCRGYPFPIVGKEDRQDGDIYAALDNLVLAWGDMGRVAEEFERTHPWLPRNPRMEVSVDPPSVSAIENDREAKLQARVTDCRGAPTAPSGNDKETVFFPKKGKRGKLKDALPQSGSMSLGARIAVFTESQGRAAAKYTLDRGIKAGAEPIPLETCALGLGNSLKQQAQIDIAGLAIAVTPVKREVGPGEQTQVYLDFFKQEKTGQRTPLAGKILKLSISGLRDGKVAPFKTAPTDANGRATLTYLAGKKDRQVKFTAKYRPQGFKETVQGQGVVTVKRKPERWELTIDFTEQGNGDYTEENNSGGFRVETLESLSVSMKAVLTLVSSDEYGSEFSSQHWQREIRENFNQTLEGWDIESGRRWTQITGWTMTAAGATAQEVDLNFLPRDPDDPADTNDYRISFGEPVEPVTYGYHSHSEGWPLGDYSCIGTQQLVVSPFLSLLGYPMNFDELAHYQDGQTELSGTIDYDSPLPREMYSEQIFEGDRNCLNSEGGQPVVLPTHRNLMYHWSLRWQARKLAD